MTNADKIRNMTNEELAEFLEDWTWEVASEMFGKEFCSKCETITAKPEGYHRELTFSKCEFDDYTCPHFEGNSVRWWLNADCDIFPNKTSNTLTK